jgi:hypothetical protein
MITTWSPHRNAGCDCSRVPWYWMCLPPASPGGEQLHKPPNVEGQPTRSRDRSRTVIDLDLSPSSAMSWRTAPRPFGGGRSTGATAERPNCGRASASAAVRRDHRAQNLRLIGSRHSITLRYPYGGR